jgi:hypothetical protein
MGKKKTVAYRLTATEKAFLKKVATKQGVSSAKLSENLVRKYLQTEAQPLPERRNLVAEAFAEDDIVSPALISLKKPLPVKSAKILKEAPNLKSRSNMVNPLQKTDTNPSLSEMAKALDDTSSDLGTYPNETDAQGLTKDEIQWHIHGGSTGPYKPGWQIEKLRLEALKKKKK